MSFSDLGDPAEPPTEYPLLGRGQLADLPPVEPLIDDVLDRREVSMFAGPWGCGKSFVALSLGLSVATGVEWLGRKTHHSGPVLLVAGEGLHGLNARVAAWEYAWSVRADQLWVLHEPLCLTDPRAVARLLLTITRLRPVLIIIDTLSRALAGAEENSARDMSLAVNTLTASAEACDGAVCVVHHTGKNGDVRGSTALAGGCDRIWTCEGDPQLLTLTSTKVKDGPTSAPLRLHLAPVRGSLVPELVAFPQESVASEHATTQKAARCLSHVCRTEPATRSVVRDVLVEELGVTRSQAYRILQRLVSAGFLRNIGSDRTPQYVTGNTP